MTTVQVKLKVTLYSDSDCEDTLVVHVPDTTLVVFKYCLFCLGYIYLVTEFLLSQWC